FIYLGDSSVIGDSSFINNSARCRLIYLRYSSVIIIGNSTFINNYAIYSPISAESIIINDSIFLNNKLNNTNFSFYNNDKTLIFNFNWGPYFINGIMGDNIILNNVTYGGYNGIMNTGQNETIEIGIPIIVEFYNSKMELVKNITIFSDYHGHASVDYTNLIMGKCFVKAYCPDNNYYRYYGINTTVTSNLHVHDVVKYYGADDRLIATVYDDEGNVISDVKVEFRINGKVYIRLTDKNGVASLGLNLNSGVYKVCTTFNNTYVYSIVTIKSTVEANDLVKMYQNDTQFYAKFVDSNGKALTNIKVQFNINGIFYTRETNNDGVAKLSINLRPGEYILTAINPVTGEQIGFDITVKSLIESIDLTKYYKNESKFEATVYNKDGFLAINKEVTFNINGVFYKRITDENGIASLGINLRPGHYIITTIVDGLEIGNRVTVLPTVLTNNLDMKFQDGSKFIATILNGQGIPLFNQNVTFNVNGVFYSKITDGDGIVRLNINLIQGKYIITTIWDDYQVGNNITIS
ncbi:Ig-like domain-containing protein, partial [uncultured Methanobrevibacter sp.]|uniref:Ig-like domain-containing protein n=1 Tax=uncultured Methanobrevibacter sp. TaxID=253161 RepID=UPI0026297102